MIRIEYKVPTASNAWDTKVIYADDLDEAEEICNKVDGYGYIIVDVSNYIDEN